MVYDRKGLVVVVVVVVGWLPNNGSVLFTYNQLFIAVCISFFFPF